MGLNERVSFLRKAREAEKLAASMPDEQDRAVWQDIAQEYFKLAEDNGEKRDRLVEARSPIIGERLVEWARETRPPRSR